MARYMIIAARCEEADFGVGCGPQMSPIVAEVELKDAQGKNFYMSASFLADAPEFYKTDVSTFDMQVRGDLSEDETAALESLLNAGFMDFGEYDDIFEAKDPEWYDIQRYLIYLIQMVNYEQSDELDKFIGKTSGKYTDAIDIPMSYAEESYVEMLEYEAENGGEEISAYRPFGEDMVVADIMAADIYGESSTVEFHLSQKDGGDRFVLFSKGPGFIAIYVNKESLIHLFASDSNAGEEDYKIARDNAIENYEIEIGEIDTCRGVLESNYYRMFDLGAYILENADWTQFDKSVAEVSRPFIGKKFTDIHVTRTLELLLVAGDEEDEY